MRRLPIPLSKYDKLIGRARCPPCPLSTAHYEAAKLPPIRRKKNCDLSSATNNPQAWLQVHRLFIFRRTCTNQQCCTVKNAKDKKWIFYVEIVNTAHYAFWKLKVHHLEIISYQIARLCVPHVSYIFNIHIISVSQGDQCHCALLLTISTQGRRSQFRNIYPRVDIDNLCRYLGYLEFTPNLTIDKISSCGCGLEIGWWLLLLL